VLAIAPVAETGMGMMLVVVETEVCVDVERMSTSIPARR
jgi:hypothetical protein